MDIKIKPKELKNKKISVLGAGISGIYASILASKKGAITLLSENNDISISDENLSALKKNKVEIEIDGHSEKVLDADVAVISPGIPKTAPIVAQLQSRNIPIVSEIEFAYWFCQTTDIIAVTGSNGKSTVTSLIYEIFKGTKYNVFCGGNLGTPFSHILLESEKYKKDLIFVLEISSFQLERILHFRPKVSIFLNITPDHLDRYEGDITKYLDSKLNITMNQNGDDYLIFNNDDKLLSKNIPESPIQIPFGVFSTCISRISFDRNNIYIDEKKLIARKKLSLPGDLNLYNILAAINAALFYDIPLIHLAKKLETFKALEHRLEFFTSIDQVDYYNDSKATNVDSTIFALKNLGKPVFIILGGKDKDSDFSLLIPVLKKYTKGAVLIGETASKIRKELSGSTPLWDAETLEEAVKTARNKTISGDIVLLSPACASFDMFDNFEHRGREFKKIVSSLQSEKSDG